MLRSNGLEHPRGGFEHKSLPHRGEFGLVLRCPVDRSHVMLAERVRPLTVFSEVGPDLLGVRVYADPDQHVHDLEDQKRPEERERG